MRKSLKNLFSSAPKFQRSLKRGVYLSALLYNEDKVLVTNEEVLPIIEVDENFTAANLHADFHWLMKIACTWEDVKALRQDMDKSGNQSTMLFRSKLLQAAAQLQSALGVQDLGQFYFKPIKDGNGSIVLVTINQVKESKAINSGNHVKWMPLSKIQKRIACAFEGLAAPELLLASIAEMMAYEQASTVSLPSGLYLGYLKLKSTVDLIRIMVPSRVPNVLPHVKIRDCANVNREEWDWLKRLSTSEVTAPPTNTQTAFQNSLIGACRKLLENLGMSDEDIITHRLFDMEVIELGEDVTFLLLLPPVENVCSIPGHTEEITENPNYHTVPVQVFEMTHMRTYQYEFISRYSRLSSILEMDTYLAQQAQREAFSSDEINEAKGRVDQLGQYQQTLDETWKGMRWTMDIITYARDKTIRGGVPLSILYAPPPSPTESPMMERRDVETATTSSCSSDMGYHSDRSSGEHTVDYYDAEDRRTDTQSNTDSEEVWTKISNQPGILRVYAAYDTGLNKGTSVKLHITPRTSAREVINLVVQQLNRSVMMKGGGPVYSDDLLEDFCLVAVFGARERVMRDEFQPLQLQNPWPKGRIYVRLKAQRLAALEHSQVTSV